MTVKYAKTIVRQVRFSHHVEEQNYTNLKKKVFFFMEFLKTMIGTLVATRTVTNYIGHNLECVNIPLTRGVIRFTKIDKLTNLSSGSLKWFRTFIQIA